MLEPLKITPLPFVTASFMLLSPWKPQPFTGHLIWSAAKVLQRHTLALHLSTLRKVWHVHTCRTVCVTSYMDSWAALGCRVWSPPPYSIVWKIYPCIPNGPLNMKYCSGGSLPIYAFWRMYTEGLGDAMKPLPSRRPEK